MLCYLLFPRMQRKAQFVPVLAALLVPSALLAAPLTEARVTKIVNDVKLVDPAASDRDAKLNDVIRNDLALTTGIKSRSELLFQDNTLTRLGPESYFSFKTGTREMTLQKGTLLLQVPKGIGGAKIHTAAVTAAITGTTIMMEYLPQRTLKVLVLEGSLRLSNGRFGDSLLLTPGRMVIMPPNAKRIPDPVTVDLKKVVKTSTLVNIGKGKRGHDKPLPSAELIEHEVDRQQQGKAAHNLVDTNLVIMGKGTNVQLTSADVLQSLDQRTDTTRAPSPVPTPVPSPVPTPPVTADIGPTPTLKVENKDGVTQTEERYGSDSHPIASPLVINTAQDFSQQHGTGSVKIMSNDFVTVNTMIKISDAGSKHGHGEISIKSGKTSGPAISITSSAQLLALLAATSGDHGMITFQSVGGDINVAGTVQADRGTIDMRNNGDGGVVALNNATLSASTIKVGALGNNGTLNVGGGTISADNIIKLYAGGSNGTINFTDNVTLNGNSVKTIAGDTVTIFDGKVVTVNGSAPANVYTNHPNYTGFGGNGSTTGTWAGQGANTQPLSAKPGF